MAAGPDGRATRSSSGRRRASGFYDADGRGHRRRLPTLRSTSGELGLDRGGHLLVERALASCCPATGVRVVGTDPHLGVAPGRRGPEPPATGRRRRDVIVRGDVEDRRAGAAPMRAGGAIAVVEPRRGVGAGGAGCAGRGRRPGPGQRRSRSTRDVVWADGAPASTRRPPPRSGTRRPRSTGRPADLPDDVEDAVVQVMTYLIENEQAALMVPARFLGRIHPHFREVVQFLATQVADEARHVEVFTRRAVAARPAARRFRRRRAGLAADAARRARLRAGVVPALGARRGHLPRRCCRSSNGSAPDPVTRQVARLAVQDEARHVAFALGHLERARRRPIRACRAAPARRDRAPPRRAAPHRRV